MKWARKPIDPVVEKKAEAVLAVAYRGIHHVEGWEKRQPYGPGVSVLVDAGISTFDFDVLTRLVVAAHDECVRLEISGAGHYSLRLAFHSREREGRMSERHPTMEQAIDAARSGPRGAIE